MNKTRTGTSRPKRTLAKTIWMTLIAGVFQIVFAFTANNLFADPGPAGTLINSQGQILRLSPSGGDGQPIKDGDIIRQGDIISTSAGGSAAILCADESLIRLNAGTTIVFERVAETAVWLSNDKSSDRSSVYRLNAGEMWLRNKNEHMIITIETAQMSAKLRGTELNLMIMMEDRVMMSVQEGLVIASNRFGSMDVAANERVTAFSGKPMEKQVVLSYAGSVQWTFSLPYLPGFMDTPLISSNRDYLASEIEKEKVAVSKTPSDMERVFRLAGLYCDAGLFDEGESLFKDVLRQAGDGPLHSRALSGLAWIDIRRNKPEDALAALISDSSPGPENILARAVCHIRMGETAKAKEALENGLTAFPEDIPLMGMKARLFIADRKFDDARIQLDKAVAKKPDDARSWSLLGLVELIQGRKKEAIFTAGKGAALGPDETLPLLIESYALQAGFQLDEARSITEKIITMDKDNVTALVQLAQLSFSNGNTAEADRIIGKALTVSPESAIAQNSLGFIRLAQRQPEKGEEAFKQAIRADSSLGDPHLGLALIAMRKGDEKIAMEEISKAVLLEPQRSIYVSYWAKMLYQLKRFDKALNMLDKAAMLDPDDPTPHYYKSLIMNDLNRPTDALNELHTAIAMNDNRAVYRSRFLLDRDLSIKNIDLSYIYKRFGFSEWAVSKANAAAKQDFSNSSAHWFLGGALNGTEDRTQCATNEILLARIMQPANQNTFNTFNDYTSFFESPAVQTTISGRVGSNDSYGGAAYVNGALPKANAAFDVNVSYDKTGGWHADNDDYYGYASGRVKWDASENDHFLFEATVTDDDYGYNALSGIYEKDAKSWPDDYTEYNSRDYEIGYHHRFSPSSDLVLYAGCETRPLNYLMYNEFGPLNSSLPDIILTTRTLNEEDSSIYRLQGQQMLKIADHQVSLGLLQQWQHDSIESDTLYYQAYLGSDYPFAAQYTDNRTDKKLTSVYLRDFWQIGRWLAIDAALYHDRMTNSMVSADTEWDITETTPRLGMIFTPSNKDTFRLAGFRYVTPFMTKRVDSPDIAGIPIFRFTIPGAVTDEYDLVWEHEWQSGFIRSGLYYLEREQNQFFRHYTYDEDNHVYTPGETHEEIDKGRMKGVNLGLNQLLFNHWGVALAYDFWETRDRLLHVQETDHRLDHLGKVGLSYVVPWGFSARLNETWRHTDFKDSNRASEDFYVTDMMLGYEMPSKLGRITFRVDNLFDKQFNWITNGVASFGKSPAREWSLNAECHF